MFLLVIICYLKGLVILILSLALLIICLIGMVKLLGALFKGSIAKILQKVLQRIHKIFLITSNNYQTI